MGIFDKAKDFMKDEQATDDALNKAADAAKKVTGGKFDDKIEQARAAADEKLGSE